MSENKQKRIVIVQSGWVFVGELTHVPHSLAEIRLENASVIRVWGTDRGLGQLALSGPQKETILDPCGTVDIPMNAVLGQIHCAPDAWK